MNFDEDYIDQDFERQVLRAKSELLFFLQTSFYEKRKNKFLS